MVSANPSLNSIPQKTLLERVGFFILLAVSAALITATVKFNLDLKEKKQVYFPPPIQIKHFTFGYHETMADLFWLRAIQDFDYCEKEIAHQNCIAKGWLFHVLNLATELSPKFVIPHSAGALALTVLVSDYAGATVIFDKAVARFPSSWKIAYNAGYHALYEEKDQAKAARLLEQAARNGAPSWVYSLASRLYTDAGKRELAEGLVRDLEASGFDQALIERMKKKISEK
jgi:hypothetical protein